jgi:hypothetical protein
MVLVAIMSPRRVMLEVLAPSQTTLVAQEAAVRVEMVLMVAPMDLWLLVEMVVSV